MHIFLGRKREKDERKFFKAIKRSINLQALSMLCFVLCNLCFIYIILYNLLFTNNENLILALMNNYNHILH